MFYEYNGTMYLLNLIDTPGHVDFSYEVSRIIICVPRSFVACRLYTRVEAQTMANFYLAFEQELTVVPVLNKVDMMNAQIERVSKQMESLFDFKADEIIHASGKSGIGITDVLKAVIERIPSPVSNNDAPLKALLFDSWFDSYRGVMCLIAVKDGSIKKGDRITLAQTENDYEVLEVGLMYPEETPMTHYMPGKLVISSQALKTVQRSTRW